MRRTAAALLAVMAVAFGACGDDDDDADIEGAPKGQVAVAAVAIKTFRFTPSQLAVEAGTTVTWTNQDAILHTATSGAPGAPDATFDGPMDGAGTTFSFTFEEPGSYKYFCKRHDTAMFGEVVVN